MNNIGRIMDQILNEYEAMNPSELNTFLDRTLSKPLGQFIQMVNNETMDAVRVASINVDERDCATRPVYALETLDRKSGRINGGVPYRSRDQRIIPAVLKTQMWPAAPVIDWEYPWAA